MLCWAAAALALDPASLPRADVVLLGEVHDNPHHHAFQARAIAHLAPRAVVWEMLTADQAAALPDDLTQPETVSRALDWANGGWPDFAMYHPIFLAAPGAVHLGAGVPRGAARAVFGQPLADVFGADAARYGLDRDLPPAAQAAREAEQMAAHCDALPVEMLPGMVAAQRLRDGVLARAVVAALDLAGGPVAVIMGTGHARRDTGVPALLALAAPEASVVSVGAFETDPGAGVPFDLVLISPPVERPDPCEAFR
jgi:uncharacterized iron-regulated protein